MVLSRPGHPRAIGTGGRHRHSLRVGRYGRKRLPHWLRSAKGRPVPACRGTRCASLPRHTPQRAPHRAAREFRTRHQRENCQGTRSEYPAFNAWPRRRGDRMRRRDVFVLVGCGVLAGAQAQTPTRSGKIGYLHPRTIALGSPTLRVLKAAWETLGYAEPESVILRSAADNPTRLPKLASELVGLGVGVLIAVGPAAVKAASELGVPVVGIDLAG